METTVLFYLSEISLTKSSVVLTPCKIAIISNLANYFIMTLMKHPSLSVQCKSLIECEECEDYNVHNASPVS